MRRAAFGALLCATLAIVVRLIGEAGRTQVDWWYTHQTNGRRV